MSDTCQIQDSISPINLEGPSLSINSIGQDSSYSESLNSMIGGNETGKMSLPSLTIFDSGPNITTENNREPLEYCLMDELNNPKANSAWTSVSLANCDPEFKILIKNMAEPCDSSQEAKDLKVESARKLLEYAAKDDKYRDLLQPFHEALLEEAFPQKLAEK